MPKARLARPMNRKSVIGEKSRSTYFSTMRWKNRRTRVVRFVRRRMGAALETLNLGHLLARLDAWGVAPDFVLGSVNPRGIRMKPSPDSVIAALRASPTPVIAREVTAGGTIPLAAGLEHARSRAPWAWS